ncbi:cache domain-containing protein [Roseomonas sp. CCTCC AB2023176]|uniref:cache domain-containing protein n=1 Tax=Roseomonas sp. CCTCC AB2023176 TaxID=3342640 RepID=UPI0035DD12FF
MTGPLAPAPQDDQPTWRPATPRSLLLVLGAAILVPVLAGIVAAWLAWRGAVADTTAALERSADAAAEYAIRVLDSHRLSAALAGDRLRGLTEAEIRAQEGALHRDLRDRAFRPAGTQSTFVLSGAGRPLVSDIIFPIPPDLDASDREWVRALANPATPEPFVSAIYRALRGGALFFSVSIRRQAGADPPGIISVAVNPNEFATGLSRLAADPTDILALIRGDGALLALRGGLTQVPPRELPPMPASAPSSARASSARSTAGPTPRPASP